MPRAYLAIKTKDGEPTSKWYAATSMPNLKTALQEHKAPDGEYKIEQHILNKNGAQQICNLLMRRGFSEHIMMTALGTVEDGVLSIKRGSTEKHEKDDKAIAKKVKAGKKSKKEKPTKIKKGKKEPKSPWDKGKKRPKS